MGGTEVVGSGNPEMPCLRMHCATFSIRAIVCADACVVEPGPRRPPGMSFWHFACAALNAGEEGFVPAPTWNPPPACGSGKLGTPLERMHSANASIFCSTLALLSGDGELPSALADEPPFPGATCATPGLDEAPQPAASSAPPTIISVVNAARGPARSTARRPVRDRATVRLVGSAGVCIAFLHLLDLPHDGEQPGAIQQPSL